MLVSFDGTDEKSSVILNACTDTGVCLFIFALGIVRLKKEAQKKDFLN